VETFLDWNNQNGVLKLLRLFCIEEGRGCGAGAGASLERLIRWVSDGTETFETQFAYVSGELDFGRNDQYARKQEDLRLSL